MQRIIAICFAIACLSGALAGRAQACEIDTPPGLRPDPSETVPGWRVYRFDAAAAASGHLLFARIANGELPPRSAAARLVEGKARAAATRLYGRRLTAAKLELFKDKTFVSGPTTGNPAQGYVFVAILAFGPDSVRASGYLRHNARAGNLSLQFAVTDPDDARAALPVVEQFASHPGQDCAAGASP